MLVALVVVVVRPVLEDVTVTDVVRVVAVVEEMCSLTMVELVVVNRGCITSVTASSGSVVIVIVVVNGVVVRLVVVKLSVVCGAS